MEELSLEFLLNYRSHLQEDIRNLQQQQADFNLPATRDILRAEVADLQKEVVQLKAQIAEHVTNKMAEITQEIEAQSKPLLASRDSLVHAMRLEQEMYKELLRRNEEMRAEVTRLGVMKSELEQQLQSQKEAWHKELNSKAEAAATTTKELSSRIKALEEYELGLNELEARLQDESKVLAAAKAETQIEIAVKTEHLQKKEAHLSNREINLNSRLASLQEARKQWEAEMTMKEEKLNQRRKEIQDASEDLTMKLREFQLGKEELVEREKSLVTNQALLAKEKIKLEWNASL